MTFYDFEFNAGNGRLRHPDGKFTDWTATSWMQQLGMNRFFQLNDGIVTVRDGGIYHIYAQVCHSLLSYISLSVCNCVIYTLYSSIFSVKLNNEDIFDKRKYEGYEKNTGFCF